MVFTALGSSRKVGLPWAPHLDLEITCLVSFGSFDLWLNMQIKARGSKGHSLFSCHMDYSGIRLLLTILFGDPS